MIPQASFEARAAKMRAQTAKARAAAIAAKAARRAEAAEKPAPERQTTGRVELLHGRLHWAGCAGCVTCRMSTDKPVRFRLSAEDIYGQKGVA